MIAMDAQAYFDSLKTQGYDDNTALGHTNQHYPEFKLNSLAGAIPNIAASPMINAVPAQQIPVQATAQPAYVNQAPQPVAQAVYGQAAQPTQPAQTHPPQGQTMGQFNSPQPAAQPMQGFNQQQPMMQGQPMQGFAQQGMVQQVGVGSRTKLLTFLLGFFFGVFGVHNFYLGKTGLGIAQLLITVLTFGIGMIITGPWALIESILALASSNFRDGDGLALQG
jgi:hypothetical protein